LRGKVSVFALNLRTLPGGIEKDIYGVQLGGCSGAGYHSLKITQERSFKEGVSH